MFLTAQALELCQRPLDLVLEHLEILDHDFSIGISIASIRVRSSTRLHFVL